MLFAAGSGTQPSEHSLPLYLSPLSHTTSIYLSFPFVLLKRRMIFILLPKGRPCNIVHSLVHGLYTAGDTYSEKHKGPLIWCRGEDSVVVQGVGEFVLRLKVLKLCAKTPLNLNTRHNPSIQLIQKLVGLPLRPQAHCFCPLTHAITNPCLGVGRRQTGWGSSSH